MPKARLASTIVALLALASAGCSTASQAGTCAGGTPEETFTHVATFIGAGDFASVAGCMTPEGRQQLAADMLANVNMLSKLAQMQMLSDDSGQGPGAMTRQQAEGLVQGFADLLATYELTDAVEALDSDAVHRRIAEVDQGSLIASLTELVDASAPVGSEQSTDLGELTDLVVEGDSAHGTAAGTPFEFQRVDDRWYLSRLSV